MARTSLNARKSTGGRAPRKCLAAARAPSLTYPDHAGRPVTTVYNCCSLVKDIIPRLSFHLYPLAATADSLSHIGDEFLKSDAIVGWGNARNWWPRVDVYSPLASVEECMAHHVREKAHRKTTNGPHIVPSWSRRRLYPCDAPSDPYRNVILVMPADCISWKDVEEKGLLWVEFDLALQPGGDVEVTEWTKTEGEESFEDCEIEKVVFGPDPCVQRVLVGREPIQRLERERQERFERGEFGTKNDPRTFSSCWTDLTMVLSDCTYRPRVCDRCENEEEHADEECDILRDMHYFNDDGECIACLNAPPWPDYEEVDEAANQTDEEKMQNPADEGTEKTI